MLTLGKQSRGVTPVYSNRAKVGYITAAKDGAWWWELNLLSERLMGHPRGLAATKDKALAAMDNVFKGWCNAAGLEKK